MDYRVEDIEDQIIATLQAQANLNDVEIVSHAGEVNINLFLDPQYYEGLVKRLPFIFVRYSGREALGQGNRSSTGVINNHILEFTLYIGAKSLRSKQESQRACYGMLRETYDALVGKYPNSNQSLASTIAILNGNKITTTNFRALSGMLESGGKDERLVIELPRIAVYQTSYKIQLGT